MLKEWIAVKIDRAIGTRCRGDDGLGFFFLSFFRSSEYLIVTIYCRWSSTVPSRGGCICELVFSSSRWLKHFNNP